MNKVNPAGIGNTRPLTEAQELDLCVNVRPYQEIPQEYKWDLNAIFKTSADWELAFERLQNSLPDAANFSGRLGERGDVLAEYLDLVDQLRTEASKLGVYASLSAATDTRDSDARERSNRASALESRLAQTLAFKDPEIVALGTARIEAFIDTTPSLKKYAFHLREIFRSASHKRSREVAEVIALAGDLSSSPAQASEALRDTNLKFGSVTLPDGNKVEITQGNIEFLRSHSDRAVRQRASEQYSDAFLSVEDTFAAMYSGAIHADIFAARSTRFSSTLAKALHQDNIPVAVFDAILLACEKGHAVWHRYWDIRAKMLRVSKLGIHDIHAPLNANPPQISWGKASQLVVDGMAPLGKEYCEALRRGLNDERWSDVFPAQGKSGNAYSSGSLGTFPYLLLNWGNSISDMSTLSHEAGHSMHSYFTCRSQPYAYSRYSMVIAETASNFNQAMVRAHLLKTGDKAFKLAVLDETFANFHRYLLIMPTLARIESLAHARIESGDAISAKSMSELTIELFSKGFGGRFDVDSKRLGTTWMQFSHLNAPFYVYTYAAGIAGAQVLAHNILDGIPGAQEKYLDLLTKGASQPPLDQLAAAGVNLADPETFERSFRILNGYIGLLEQLI